MAKSLNEICGIKSEAEMRQDLRDHADRQIFLLWSGSHEIRSGMNAALEGIGCEWHDDSDFFALDEFDEDDLPWNCHAVRIPHDACDAVAEVLTSSRPSRDREAATAIIADPAIIERIMAMAQKLGFGPQISQARGWQEA